MNSNDPAIITVVGLFLGVLGLIASIVGTALAYFAFVNPKVRVNRYLKNPESWEEVHLNLKGGHSLWRYNKHPEFTIEETNETESWDYGVTEAWMKYPLPDPSKTTYMLHVKAGNIVVYAERVITLDGGRYLVPLPRVKYHEQKKDNEYYYIPLQMQIARIVGNFYRMKSIDEFTDLNEIEVRENG